MEQKLVIYKVTKVCEWCNASIPANTELVEDTQTRQFFCDVVCKDQYNDFMHICND